MLVVRVVRVGECGEEMGVIVTREHLNSSQDKKIKKCSDACDVGILFTRYYSNRCVNAHARQLIGERRRGSDTPGYAVFSRDFCKVYSYHDTLPNHQLGRSHSSQMPCIHLDNIMLVQHSRYKHKSTLCAYIIPQSIQ